MNDLTKTLPLVSIIIANYNGKHLLKDCFDSLYAIDYPKNRFEIIMVDNGSEDNSIAFVKKTYPGVKIIKNNINNYCKANNLGVAKSQGEFVVFLNNDTVVNKYWLIKLIKVMDEFDKVAAVGSKILLLNGKIQSTGHVEFPNYYWGDRGFQEEDIHQYDKVEMVKSISNCSALYRKKALIEAGGFDEDFVMYMEDVDLAFRLRKKGWRILYAPESRVFHKLHGSGQSEAEIKFHSEKNRLLFIVKYFPSKLMESIYGYGEILKLNIVDFHTILIAVYQKLIKHYGLKKADAVFQGLRAHLQTMEIYNFHCFEVELENKTLSLQQKFIPLEEKIKAQANKILTKDAALQSLDAKYTDQQQAIGELEKKIKAQANEILTKDAALQVLDAKYTDQQQAIGELEKKIKAQANEILTKDAALQVLDAKYTDQQQAIGELEKKIKAQANEILTKDAALQSLDVKYADQQQTVEELEKKIKAQANEILAKDAALQVLEAKYTDQQQAARILEDKIRDKDAQIVTNKEIIEKKEQRILELSLAISQIYESGIYCYFIKPLVWPMLSFVKNASNLFNNKYKGIPDLQKKYKKPSIFIAQFYSKNAKVFCASENVYYIKLVNKQFSEEKVKIMVDIWPYRNRRHPERHFAYFMIEVTLKPRGMSLLKVIYNWDKKVESFVGDHKQTILDFWRGTLDSSEFYAINAHIYNLDSIMLSESSIVQMK